MNPARWCMIRRRDPRILLRDIEMAANRIEGYVDGVVLATFVADDGLQDQVERNFITMGEALNQLDRISPELVERIPDAVDITGFRHRLVHDYDRIRPQDRLVRCSGRSSGIATGSTVAARRVGPRCKHRQDPARCHHRPDARQHHGAAADAVRTAAGRAGTRGR